MEKILSDGLQTQVYRFDGIWLDIGRAEDYAQAAEVFEQSRDLLLPR
jgi:NDP-sugar pyrophosphorylase family protein